MEFLVEVSSLLASLVNGISVELVSAFVSKADEINPSVPFSLEIPIDESLIASIE